MDQLALPGGVAEQASVPPVTRAQFARILGVDEAYVRRLAKQGRLALTDDAERPLVHVDPSLARLAATMDLSKRGVRERWAAYRAERGWLSERPDPMAQAAPAANMPPTPPPSSPACATSPEPSEYHRAQTDLARTMAALRFLELRQKSGEVAETAPMVRAVATISATFVGALDGLPDRLAQQLAAEADPAACHALLTAAVERIRIELQRALDELARKAGAPAPAPAPAS